MGVPGFAVGKVGVRGSGRWEMGDGRRETEVGKPSSRPASVLSWSNGRRNPCWCRAGDGDTLHHAQCCAGVRRLRTVGSSQ